MMSGAPTRLARHLQRWKVAPEVAEAVERKAAEERARDEREQARAEAEHLRLLAASSLRGEFGSRVKQAAEEFLLVTKNPPVVKRDLDTLRAWARKAKRMRARRR